jgi:hypothetical protein
VNDSANVLNAAEAAPGISMDAPDAPGNEKICAAMGVRSGNENQGSERVNMMSCECTDLRGDVDELDNVRMCSGHLDAGFCLPHADACAAALAIRPVIGRAENSEAISIPGKAMSHLALGC